MQTSSNSSMNVSQKYEMNSTTRLAFAQTSRVRSDVSEFIKGEIVKAEILDLRGLDIKLLLSNGQMLKGTMQSNVPLFIGDHASFLIEETNPNPVLKYMPEEKNSNPIDPTINKALEEALLPKNEKNTSIVNALLKNGMSIDKNSIISLLRQTTQFRNASIDTLALMNKYQIPINDSTTTQLEAYRNYEYRLLAQTNQLTDSIQNAISQLPKDSPLIKEFIQLFDQSNLSPEDKAMVEHALSSSTETMPESFDATPLPTENSAKDIKDNTLTAQSDSMNVPKDSEFVDKLNDSTEFTTLIKEQDTTKKDTISPNQVKEPSLLETLLKSEFTLNLKQLNKPEGISKFYERLEKDLDKINEFFQKNNENISKELKDTVSSQTNNLKENIDFMKTINQMFGYVQLPMKLPNQNAHSELFVYTDKKKLQSKDEQVSVLLHLDMDHLGPLDFHLTLKKRYVAAKISLENASSMALIEQHMPELEKALALKGYTMTYQMEKLEKETKIVRDALESETNDILIRRYAFDKRA